MLFQVGCLTLNESKKSAVSSDIFDLLETQPVIPADKYAELTNQDWRLLEKAHQEKVAVAPANSSAALERLKSELNLIKFKKHLFRGKIYDVYILTREGEAVVTYRSSIEKLMVQS